jgi:hypothetical protein
MTGYRAARDAWQRLVSRRRGRYALIALTAAAAVAVIAALLPDASSSRHPSRHTQPRTQAAGAAVQPVAQVSARRKPVTLVTGNAVRLATGPGVRSVVSVTPPRPTRRFAASMVAHTFIIGGDVYSVPGYALPFLGNLLDARLFDASYLLRAGYAARAALPVSVTWRRASHTPVPGLTAARSGRTTSGSVRTAGAFGQALADLSRAMLHRGTSRTAAATALAQVQKISLAPLGDRLGVAPAVPLRSPAAPAGTKLYTLTLDAITTAGQAGYAIAYVQDLKSLQRYYSVTFLAPGNRLALSVPAGSYGIEATVFDLDLDFNLPENIAFVPLPEVDISADTSITMDARRARPIDVSVPSSDAAVEMATLSFARTSADGDGLQDAIYTFGPAIADFLPEVHLYAVPTPAPRIGSLGFADAWEFAPAGMGLGGVDAPYTYSLDFASSHGVPDTLSHAVALSDLATVHERFAASVAGSNSYSAAAPFHSWSTVTYALSPVLLDFPVPAERTDYFGGSTDTVWELSAQLVPLAAYIPPAIRGPFTTFHPGDERTVTWGASPSVPAPEWQSMGLPTGTRALTGAATNLTWSYICPVCRQGDVMGFSIVASGDDDPTHSTDWQGLGSGTLENFAGGPTDSLTFYRNDTLTQTAAGSGLVLPMLPGPARYRIDWARTVPSDSNTLATSVHSVWTFTSTRPSRTDRVPSYELCSPDSTQPCSFVPLVFASYDFGADLSGNVAAPGAQSFTVTGYHEAGANAGVVADASVQVSFDDGATWAPAGVTPVGGGRFRVSLDAPDPASTSGYVSIKVRLADPGGNVLDQTILRAYALSEQATR